MLLYLFEFVGKIDLRKSNIALSKTVGQAWHWRLLPFVSLILVSPLTARAHSLFELLQPPGRLASMLSVGRPAVQEFRGEGLNNWMFQQQVAAVPSRSKHKMPVATGESDVAAVTPTSDASGSTSVIDGQR